MAKFEWKREGLAFVALFAVVLSPLAQPTAGAAPTAGIIVQPQPLLALDQGEEHMEATELIGGLTETKGPRNPFAPTNKLLMLKNQPAAAASLVAASEFTPMKQAEKMPKLKLRGHLQGEDGEVLALLELVGGDVYIVREGDTVGLHDFGIDSVIRVHKISRLHLV